MALLTVAKCYGIVWSANPCRLVHAHWDRNLPRHMVRKKSKSEYLAELRRLEGGRGEGRWRPFQHYLGLVAVAECSQYPSAERASFPLSRGWFTLSTQNSLIHKCSRRFLELNCEKLHTYTIKCFEMFQGIVFLRRVIGGSKVLGSNMLFLDPRKPAKKKKRNLVRVESRNTP